MQKAICLLFYAFDFKTTAPTDNCFDPDKRKCLLCLTF